MASNNKMKGLLKGLRYISQIFDNDKEPEMQIGNPTDVKHVAHIGWDGPSVDSGPRWMNEYKATPDFSSAPLASEGKVREEDPAKWVSQDRSHNGKGLSGQNSSTRNMPELPKSSKRSSNEDDTGEAGSSTLKEKTDKHKQSRKPSKSSSSSKDNGSDSHKPRKSKDPNKTTGLNSQDLPGIPKKSSRRKKSKDSLVDGSSRRHRRTQDLDTEPELESVCRPQEERLISNALSFEDGEDNNM